ncbi:TIGR02449 family protein [Halieaceae bacterium IMCC14734]|uniref:TIGR02449 family protein n=2 Tax=Candidatus Litorirhabdus singularis TaxID=2518993 RepID=A0ABT3TCS4_9GAMM|nr:TIGR02449 family protein [Candidatus Litorirhabdus singularis]
MPDSQLQLLEEKIDTLIELCADLNRENASLKANANSWSKERQNLIDKNELAKTKVEAIISRLKAMEQDS